MTCKRRGSRGCGRSVVNARARLGLAGGFGTRRPHDGRAREEGRRRAGGDRVREDPDRMQNLEREGASQNLARLFPLLAVCSFRCHRGRGVQRMDGGTRRGTSAEMAEML